MQWLFIALAGAVGSSLRYAVGRLVGVHAFPWATLGINVVGSFALGYLLAGPLRERLSEAAVVGLAVGLLGAFTTFSTFGYETITLARTGRTTTAALYVAASLVLGLVATAAGVAIGRNA